ncbi:MAG TPA: LeuA family protein [Planctomycetota bacterium]|nr:LeuA family protein [Planctomycetota bacterium]
MNHDLIHDWNLAGDAPRRPSRRIEFDDETLRDGLQSPSATSPTVDQKMELLRLMDALGLDAADIGLPGAGGAVKEDTLALARGMAAEKLRIAPNCAARTLEADIRPIAEIVQKTGRPIQAALFIGSSPIRQFAEDWTIEKILEHTKSAVAFAVKQGLEVMYVTEDTTRANPKDLERLFLAAVECGAKRLCLCDTCGHATPHGVAELVRFTRGLLDARKLGHVRIDFHGHMDRGLGVWNAVAALEAGADRVHGTALGIGERVGNAPMDQILVNLKLLGWIDNDLQRLYEYCLKSAEYVGIPIPHGYPVVGKDAFETATGVHAAAIIKAMKKGDAWLADRVYSGVPAGEFGREQEIAIGPMSGRSNVVYWLEKRGLPATEGAIAAILARAKQSSRLLLEPEIREALGRS